MFHFKFHFNKKYHVKSISVITLYLKIIIMVLPKINLYCGFIIAGSSFAEHINFFGFCVHLSTKLIFYWTPVYTVHNFFLPLKLLDLSHVAHENKWKHRRQKNILKLIKLFYSIIYNKLSILINSFKTKKISIYNELYQ